MQREQYGRESQKGPISPFAQHGESHFCSRPSVTAATARVKKASCLAGSFERFGVTRAWEGFLCLRALSLLCQFALFYL